MHLPAALTCSNIATLNDGELLYHEEDADISTQDENSSNAIELS